MGKGKGFRLCVSFLTIWSRQYPLTVDLTLNPCFFENQVEPVRSHTVVGSNLRNGQGILAVKDSIDVPFDRRKVRDHLLLLFDLCFQCYPLACFIAQGADRGRIGFDSDQWQLFADTDPQKAGYIVSSMMKNVDAAVFRAIELTIKGELAYGATESLGIAEGGVGLADNENFKAIVPAKFVEIIKEAEEKIISGEIIVDTAL